MASNHAQDDEKALPATAKIADFDRLDDRAIRDRTIAIVALATGATALAGGIARLAFVRHRDRAADAAIAGGMITFAPSGGGGTLLWQGRF